MLRMPSKSCRRLGRTVCAMLRLMIIMMMRVFVRDGDGEHDDHG